MPGGAAAYRKGATIERLVARAYRAQGCFVIRSPQSGSAIDLLVVHPLDTPNKCVHFTEWVQVKSQGYLRPAERQEVIQLARWYGGMPVLAWAKGSGPIHRRNLEEGVELEDLENPGPVSRANSARVSGDVRNGGGDAGASRQKGESVRKGARAGSRPEPDLRAELGRPTS